MLDQTEHEALKAAAENAVRADSHKKWQDTVLNALAALETYEHEHDLPRTSEKLLQDAIIGKLRLQPNLSATELKVCLEHLGVTITTSAAHIAANGTSERERTGNGTASSGHVRPDPRAARIITALADRGFDLKNDIEITIIPRAAGSWTKEPYWLITVRPQGEKWGRQMAVCNLTRQNSYVGSGIRTPEQWAELLSDKSALTIERLEELGIVDVPKNGITDEKHTARMLEYCENGVRGAKITADTILECMYHYTAETRQLAGAKGHQNLLRPLEAFSQYRHMLNEGLINGQPKGSTLTTLLLDDLTSRARKWRKKTGALPDENTDEPIDPSHPSLARITWTQMAQAIKNNKQYGFHLSEEWQNRGLTGPKLPQTAAELAYIDAALTELQENGQLPDRRTKTKAPDGTNWAAIRDRLRRQDSSLPRFFRTLGLTALAEAFNRPLTAADFAAAGDTLDPELEGQPSVSIIPENHPARTEERERIKEQDSDLSL